jgi:serine/threonine protein kinase
MGGGQSRQPVPPPLLQQGSNTSDDDNQSLDECKPCFFLGGHRRRDAALDAIGSPLPDTPLMERRRREDVKKAVRHGIPIFSSRYGGLEKEPSSSILTFAIENGVSGPLNGDASISSVPYHYYSNFNVNGFQNESNAAEDEAVVYEGDDADQKLHAKYDLKEVLGVGSTSTVHRCVRRDSGEEFSCKVIDCQLIEERFQGMMPQFQTEIESLRKLKHPGIIELYDVYIKSNDKIYIVMELMNGGELFDYVVEKGTLTEEEASSIVRKVAEALCYLHQKNIIHRDLKPENLLLKHKPPPNGSEQLHPVDVKIIDFGLSKAMVVDDDMARTFLGTRGYLAPEMLQRREYTRAVDAWALGVIVFVLLCGCLPFDDDSAAVPNDDLVQARFTLRFPRWAKNLSASAKDLLHHLLDVNPTTRYTAGQALRHPWVRGETAPKGNLLASPGRIKKSPALIVASNGSNKRASKTANGGGQYVKANGRKYAPDPTQTPPAPMIRKGSI